MALKISPVYFEKIKKASFAFRMKSGDRTENLTELRHNQLIRLTGMWTPKRGVISMYLAECDLFSQSVPIKSDFTNSWILSFSNMMPLRNFSFPLSPTYSYST